MKFLLTSAGIKNASIHDALVDLLGKPIAESNALCIPTAGYGHPQGSPGGAWRFISGQSHHTHVRIGLEVLGRAGAHRAAQHRRRTLGPLGSRDRRPAGEWRRRPVPVPLDAAVRAGGPPAVAGRDGLGGAERREHGDDPRIGEDFVGWKPPTGGDSTLGIVDFSIFPHLDHEDLPENTMADAERWAAGLASPAYAIDDRDRHQSDRRHRRSRLRGALETVHPLRLTLRAWITRARGAGAALSGQRESATIDPSARSRRRATREGSSPSDVSSSAQRACSRASAWRPSAA